MKRPIEEEEGTDDKCPNKKKKKLQKKCTLTHTHTHKNTGYLSSPYPDQPNNLIIRLSLQDKVLIGEEISASVHYQPLKYNLTDHLLLTCLWCKVCYLPHVMLSAPEDKAEPPQAMNALMRLNQLKPGLQYKLVSQTGPVHVPVFTMAVEVDGTTFEASGPSKRTAKLHVAVKVSPPFSGERLDVTMPKQTPAVPVVFDKFSARSNRCLCLRL